MPLICFLNISSARETPCGISKSLQARVYFLREYWMEGLVKIWSWYYRIIIERKGPQNGLYKRFSKNYKSLDADMLLQLRAWNRMILISMVISTKTKFMIWNFAREGYHRIPKRWPDKTNLSELMIINFKIDTRTMFPTLLLWILKSGGGVRGDESDV